jgi:hypothetical protein
MILIAVYLAALGDAATAATIAGAFTIVNTGLSALALRWLQQSRRDQQTTATSVAHAATASLAAAEAATEACRVAKSIGAAIRHEDPLIIQPAQAARGERP